MIRYIPVNQQLNQSTQDYVDSVSDALIAAGAVGVQDVFVTRRLDYQTVRFATTLVITDPGPAQVRAAYFSTLAGSSVDTQVDAFFAANPTYRILFVRDVSQEIRRRLDRDAVMVFYIEGLIPNCGQDRSRPVIVQALGDIAAGATGQVQLAGAVGVESDVFTVTNRSALLWSDGARGYAQVQPWSCMWVGYPTCCAPAAPVNVTPPSISGVAYSGYTLTAVPGAWIGATTVTGQWHRNGVPIFGATATTYLVTVADEGVPLTYVEDGGNGTGTTQQASNALQQFTPLDLAPDLAYDPADATTVSLVGSRIAAVANKGTFGVNPLNEGVANDQPLYDTLDGKGTINCDFTGKSMDFGSIGATDTTAFSLLLGTAPPYDYTSPVSGRVQFGSNSNFNRFCFTRDDDPLHTIVQRPAGFNSGTLVLAQAPTGPTAETHTKPAGVSNVNDCNSYQNGSGSQNYTSTSVSFGVDNGNTINTVNLNGNRRACQYLYLAVLTRVITTTEREKWEGFLAWRYHDTSNLPLAHPYKNTPPLP